MKDFLIAPSILSADFARLGEDVEKVFARRYRTSDAEKAHPTGTGLGLWIAQEIMLLHGGKIIVEATNHVGKTVFHVILPRREK